LVARVTAQRVIGGNLDQDDAEPVGSSIHIAIRPHGSVAGLPRTLRALQRVIVDDAQRVATGHLDAATERALLASTSA
jgi:hypothetical protein